MHQQESWKSVGNKIRYLRKSNGLTLRQLAQGCGLSANTISLVERSEVAPTIETICKIANALGVSPSSLFLEICMPDVVIQRRMATSCGVSPPDLAVQHLKTSQQEKRDLPMSPHSSLENLLEDRDSILCLCGQVEIELDGQNYCLRPGDSLGFNRKAYHRWRNLENETSILVFVLHPTTTEESQ